MLHVIEKMTPPIIVLISFNSIKIFLNEYVQNFIENIKKGASRECVPTFKCNIDLTEFFNFLLEHTCYNLFDKEREYI